MAISSEQCRAARGWLDWSQKRLATSAGVGLSTVADFEKGRRTPSRSSLDAITETFSDAGISFLFAENGEAAGLRRNS